MRTLDAGTGALLQSQMTRAAGSLGKCNFGLYFALSCCGGRVAGASKGTQAKTDFAPRHGTLDSQRAGEGGDQALDVPEILMRQPDCLFPPTRSKRGWHRIWTSAVEAS